MKLSLQSLTSSSLHVLYRGEFFFTGSTGMKPYYLATPIRSKKSVNLNIPSTKTVQSVNVRTRRGRCPQHLSGTQRHGSSPRTPTRQPAAQLVEPAGFLTLFGKKDLFLQIGIG